MKTIPTILRAAMFVSPLILIGHTANAMHNGIEDPNAPAGSTVPVSASSSAASSSSDKTETIASQIRKVTPWALPKLLEVRVHKLLRSSEENDDKKDTLIYLYASLFAEIRNSIKAIGYDLSDSDMEDIRQLIFSQSKVELDQLAADEDLKKASIQVDLLDIVKSETLKDYILVYWLLKNIPPDSDELDLTSLRSITRNQSYLPINNLLRLPPMNKFTALTTLTLCLPPLPLETELTKEQVDTMETVIVPLATIENHNALLELPKLENLHLEQTRRVSFPDYKRSSSMTALNLESTQLKQILDPHKIIPTLLWKDIGIIWKVSFIGKGQ